MNEEQIKANKKKIAAAQSLTKTIKRVIATLAAGDTDKSNKAKELERLIDEFDADYESARKHYKEYIDERIDELQTITIAGCVHCITQAGEEVAKLDPEDEQFSEKMSNRIMPIKSFEEVASKMVRVTKDAAATMQSTVDLRRVNEAFIKFSDSVDNGEDVDIDSAFEHVKDLIK